MKLLKKTLLLLIIPFIATASTYACDWNKKSKAQKTMTQIQKEPLKTYASNWSDARNSELLKFPTTASKNIKPKVAHKSSKTSSIN